MANALILHQSDNVLNALDDIDRGELISCDGYEGRELRAKEPIPFGFKAALRDISENEYIIKYGEKMGRASRNISCGELVHVHNIEGCRGRGDLENA